MTGLVTSALFLLNIVCLGLDNGPFERILRPFESISIGFMSFALDNLILTKRKTEPYQSR